MKPKIYLGIKGATRQIFKSDTVPTRASHGEQFAAVWGPFRTMRGAKIAQAFGVNNPHIQQVSDAERIGKAHPEYLNA